MPDCDHDCSSCGEACEGCEEYEGGKGTGIEKAPMNADSNIRKVIGVISGKGGVGKSSVTALLASASARAGRRTAVLDADITGPSIPNAFGCHDMARGTGDGEIIPTMTGSGIEIMSTNLLLEDEREPVIWRGPILGGVIQQFWSDVIWGDVEIMYLDMPPGTGDVALTVFQQLPVDGVIIVTSPQEMVSMIVEKAVRMAALMDIPVLGIVENMSYFKCPDCGSVHKIFGESHVEEEALKYGISEVVRLPIDAGIASSCDRGTVEDLVIPEIEELEKKLAG